MQRYLTCNVHVVREIENFFLQGSLVRLKRGKKDKFFSSRKRTQRDIVITFLFKKSCYVCSFKVHSRAQDALFLRRELGRRRIHHEPHSLHGDLEQLSLLPHARRCRFSLLSHIHSVEAKVRNVNLPFISAVQNL